MDLETIKNALKAADLGEDLASKIKATSQKALDAEIKKLKEEVEKLSPKTFLEVIKLAGFEKEFETYLTDEKTKEADRRVTEAVKTHDDKLKKEKEEAEAKTKEEQERLAKEKERLEKEKTMTDDQKVIESLKTDVKASNEKFDKLMGKFDDFMGKTKADKLDIAKEAAITAAKFPTNFKTFLDVDDESKIKERIELMQTGIEEIKEKNIETWVDEQKPPLLSKGKAGGAMLDAMHKYIEESKEGGGEGAASEQLGITKEQ